MICIILAGGKGKRMCSDLPKVLHHVKNPFNKTQSYPMIIHILIKAIKLNIKRIFIIVGEYKDIIKSTIDEFIKNNLITEPDIIEYVFQSEALGTGHAIKCTLPYIEKYNNDHALILSGDVPLISLNTLINLTKEEDNKLLITELDNPFGCGRIILEQNELSKIVEEKDCNDEEKN